jgi:hypothetical protein
MGDQLRFLFPLVFCSFALADNVEEVDWVKLYEQEGITGYKRHSADSRYHEWRGEGVIDAPFHRVVAVYMDSNRSCEWMADCVANLEVEKPNLEHQTTYNRTHLPRPFWDRDFVFTDEYDFNSVEGSVFDTMKSVEHPTWPEQEGVVRGNLLSSSFYARIIDEDSTWVEVRIHVEPKGNLPAWLVNLFSRSWPYDTFRDLRHQAMTAEGYDDLEKRIRQAHPIHR